MPALYSGWVQKKERRRGITWLFFWMPARRSQTISEVLGPYIWPRSTPWSCRYRGTPLLTEQLLLWMNYAGLCLIQYKAEQETMHTFRTWDLGPLRGGPIIPSYNLIQVESSCSLPGPEELSQTQTSGQEHPQITYQ